MALGTTVNYLVDWAMTALRGGKNEIPAINEIRNQTAELMQQTITNNEYLQRITEILMQNNDQEELEDNIDNMLPNPEDPRFAQLYQEIEVNKTNEPSVNVYAIIALIIFGIFVVFFMLNLYLYFKRRERGQRVPQEEIEMK